MTAQFVSPPIAPVPADQTDAPTVTITDADRAAARDIASDGSDPAGDTVVIDAATKQATTKQAASKTGSKATRAAAAEAPTRQTVAAKVEPAPR